MRQYFLLLVLALVVASGALRAVSPSGPWDKLDVLLESAVSAGTFPGCVGLIGTEEGILYAKAFGNFTYGAPPPMNNGTNPAVTLSTMWDLASCSKVVGATSAMAQFYQRGEIDLDTPVINFLPDFGANGKAPITVRMLLTHSSGFPPDPYPNYYQNGLCPESVNYNPGQVFTCQQQIFTNIMNQSLQNPINSVYVYSDLNFITLAYVIGNLARTLNYIQPSDLIPACYNTSSSVSAKDQCFFEAYVRKYVFEATGMWSTGWLPPTQQWSNCAPTTNDTWYRHVVKQGTVDDDNAYTMGGIAGHAGVFSTLEDLSNLMHRLMYAQADDSFLNATTVKYFTTEWNHTQSSRALGWNTNDLTAPDMGWNHTCGTLSPSTWLHLGFTGTQLCGDPVRQIYTILLTNRVYPSDSNEAILPLRQAWNTAIQQIWDSEQQARRRSPLGEQLSKRH